MNTSKKKTLQVFEIGMASLTDLNRKLTYFSRENNAGSKPFMQGHTFDSGLAFLDQIEKLIYNDQNRKLPQEPLRTPWTYKIYSRRSMRTINIYLK